MKWRECTMKEAFEHARYRDIDDDKRVDDIHWWDAIVFTDGTVVAHGKGNLGWRIYS